MGVAPQLLVVGGTGFIGRHIVRYAADLGWAVTSIGLSPSRQGNDAVPGVRYKAANVADRDALTAVLGDAAFDYVVNCGGYIDHAPFARGGRAVMSAHFDGVLNLLELLKRQPMLAFVNIGSSDEYGDAPAPQAEILREAPIAPYSAAKVAATHFLQMLHRTEQLPVITLRLFLTYGPGQDARRFLPQIIRGCLENRAFPASRGEQVRDFCFVQDTVDAVFAAFRSPGAVGEVINIASGEPVSIRQVIETVQRLVGRGRPRFGEILYRPGENMRLFADISKARALLGWTPRTPLQRGLETTIQWVRDHA